LKARERICLALDVASAHEARSLARRFTGRVGWLKIGLELFVSEGPPLVEELSRSANVFLDLKLHDIPATVSGAVRAAVRTGAAMVNVHAAGGREMMRRAGEAARDEATHTGMAAPRIVAVTVLTSLDETALFEVGIAGLPDEAAARLAHLAKESELDGVVCSRLDLPRIRAACGPDFWTVVPGIRPTTADAQDQKRIGTPREALSAGATILVIGRPITQAADPEAALEAIVAEMET
jgi:orotidine-5'-phosphate decarboxylase